MENLEISSLNIQLSEEKAKNEGLRVKIEKLVFELKRGEISSEKKRSSLEEERRVSDQLMKKMHRKLEQ